MAYRIFLVEDDPGIRSELAALLQKHGYSCGYTQGFDDVVRQILGDHPHLVLLDINLPQMDGYQICRELRRRSQVPVIMVTSRDSRIDELLSMNLGADDFIAKPYHAQILLARIAAVLKRAYQAEEKNELAHNGVTLNLSNSMLRANGKEVELTKNESRILQMLIRNRGSILSREELMNELWQSDEFVDDNTLTVNINRLRKKLEAVGVHDYLTTRRGRGYMV